VFISLTFSCHLLSLFQSKGDSAATAKLESSMQTQIAKVNQKFTANKCVKTALDSRKHRAEAPLCVCPCSLCLASVCVDLLVELGFADRWRLRVATRSGVLSYLVECVSTVNLEVDRSGSTAH